MMKCCIYARVSKDDQSSKGVWQNPDNQLQPLREYAKLMGWEIRAEYIDFMTGGVSNRPQFQTMLSKVKMRHFDIILVWSLDRFSREGIKNTLAYIEMIRKYKTHLKSLQESWCDTSEGGVSELLLSIMSWVAQEERKKISERTKAGLQRRKAEGVKLGRPRKNKSEAP